MAFNRIVVCAALLLGFTAASAAQQTVIKKVPAPYTPISEPSQMYTAYCAACHGSDGKGNGPAAPALKVAPTDLTTLATRSGGKFPYNHVYETIKGDANLPAHGSKDMPVWGPVFRSIDVGRDGEVKLRLSNLTGYIESLQGK
jgi:mono/diheme cytochrome c family protein